MTQVLLRREDSLETRATLVLHAVIEPALASLAATPWPRIPSGPAVSRCLVAIGALESSFLHRDQVDAGADVLGPALGLWQMERGGGVAGVLRHDRTKTIAKALCAQVGIAAEPDAVWRRLKVDDIFAAEWARLLIWTDPFAVPTTRESAWVMYCDRLWRPGKPRPAEWLECWAIAEKIVSQPLPY